MKKPNKLSPEVVNELQDRLINEYTAFFAYREASNWCMGAGYEKAAEYFKNESNDELEHAKKIEDYLVDWNITPVLPTITPMLNYTGLFDIIQKAYDLEYNLYADYEASSMKMINNGNVGVFEFLGQFREIQTTSVAEYSTLLNKLEGVKENKETLLLLEKTLFKK